MTLRCEPTSAPLRPAHFVLGPVLLLSTLLFAGAQVQANAQTRPATSAPESAYGGLTVEDILARVNDQIITRSDYDRAMKEMDGEAREHGATTLQQISEAHRDLLRNLIDQQLWLSKGKELEITGETELVKQLDEIRKKYNLETLEDLEKAAKEQGVSFEDFKANIRNQIITQEVIRQEVGRKVSVTPGEAQRYFEAHKQEYAQPESVRLSEILVSTGPTGDDADRLATAKAKADDIEAKLKAGGDFDQLARTQSDGQTATEGGDLGKYGPGSLAKVLEDATFSLQTGQFTEPIRTKQGYVILKVTEHVKGGVPQFKDVQNQVEETYYMSRMEPAIRAYLTTLREDSYIDIRPGYVDTGASARQTKPVYSAYTPPAPKKKRKVQRTRFRETEHGFRKKPAQVVPVVATAATPTSGKAAAAPTPATMKAGKKEKIRFGKAPTKTLPSAPNATTEDAGAVQQTAGAAPEPENPLEANTKPTQKTRYSARASVAKPKQVAGALKVDPQAPAPADAAEVADRQTQAAPLGLGAHMAKNKKKTKATATTGEKTRLADKKKNPADDSATPPAPTPQPIPPVPGAPAPATAPTPQPKQ